MTKFRVLRGRHNENKITYTAGQIVESNVNLVKRFGAEKFQKVDGLPDTGAPFPGDNLDQMTISELRKMAEEEEIDLGNATRKESIIDAIRNSEVAAG